MPSSHLILCHPLLLLPPIPPNIGVISNESTLPMRWPKYWSFSFSISPSKEHLELITFRMDWLDLLAVQLSRVFSNTTVQSINSSALNFLHSPTLTPIHNHWKNHRRTFVGISRSDQNYISVLPPCPPLPFFSSFYFFSSFLLLLFSDPKVSYQVKLLHSRMTLATGKWFRGTMI